MTDWKHSSGCNSLATNQNFRWLILKSELVYTRASVLKVLSEVLHLVQCYLRVLTRILDAMLALPYPSRVSFLVVLLQPPECHQEYFGSAQVSHSFLG